VTSTIATQGVLLDVFERIENVFRRLEVYIEVPPTVGMTDAIVKVLIEVLCILAIVTKDIKENRASESIPSYRPECLTYRRLETFGKRLMGRNDLEGALQKLEKVAAEEARMASAESLKAIHDVGHKVGDEAHGIHDAVKAVEDRVKEVEGIVRGIGDMVITGARSLCNLLSLLFILTAIGIEKPGLQVANDPDAMVAESSKISGEADNNIEAVDNEAPGVRNIPKGIPNRARNVNRVRIPVSEIEVSGMDGAHAIYNNPSTVGAITRCV
jgi:hypothetical protein